MRLPRSTRWNRSKTSARRSRATSCDHHPHVGRRPSRIAEQPLERIRVDGREHPHAFCGKSSASREPAAVRHRRDGLRVESGIDELFLLKSTDSAFCRFPPRPLYDASGRLRSDLGHDAQGRLALRRAARPIGMQRTLQIRRALLETFADHQSLSVQQTLHAMGAAALEAAPEIERITLTMPNKHRILVDLKPFGLENANEVFVATDEPHGIDHRNT